ncbi:flavin monoamine oxidase family protein [Pararhizobium mangrovi]|uniref:Flavin monoamine oxidase family protein n=1 Tax=Pararhizobium mangrovi TaxID=2590452 RepID=A0A506U0Z3_9HYPH|nr:flavin monoamine oxidase family protein [Pararhizobium mangrovi]TPW27440.1 flavin monoamine oxidase family protein [Pararhizobium mangrovi]
MNESVDVVVVGAGFTGLAAASRLRELGLSCLVLEARDRVGGRVEASPNGLGETVDTGGQFLCEDMANVTALAKRFGKTLVETPTAGRVLVRPPMDGEATDRLLADAHAMRDRLNTYEPDDAAIAGITVAAWTHRQPESPDARRAFRAMIEGLWCIEADRLPLWYLASNDRRITNETSELQYFVAGTMHALARDLASELEASLRLRSPVTRVARSSDGVDITAMAENKEQRFHARAALLALPPATAAGIDFAPALPERLIRALAAWRSGKVIKILLRYESAFWRADGHSGTVMWREPSSLYVFETSPSADRAMLTVFAGGPLAKAWHGLDEPALRNALLEHLAEALGEAARKPLDMKIRDWTDDAFSGGAYSDVVVDMDATDAEETLRAGLPPLHFASSELSPSYPGYIEGALVAGRNVADAIADTLDAAQSPIATSASGS